MCRYAELCDNHTPRGPWAAAFNGSTMNFDVHGFAGKIKLVSIPTKKSEFAMLDCYVHRDLTLNKGSRSCIDGLTHRSNSFLPVSLPC